MQVRLRQMLDLVASKETKSTATASPQVLLGVRALQTTEQEEQIIVRPGETTPSDSFVFTERHD